MDPIFVISTVNSFFFILSQKHHSSTTGIQKKYFCFLNLDIFLSILYLDFTFQLVFFYIDERVLRVQSNFGHCST